mgnify:CR=1 FL=1
MTSLDQISTLVLVPQVVDAVRCPVIAAGGIADGRGLAASFALGAAGVQHIWSSDSIAHPSNCLPLAELLAGALS